MKYSLLVLLCIFSLQSYSQDLPRINLKNPLDTIKNSQAVKKSSTNFIKKEVDRFNKKSSWSMKNPVIRLVNKKTDLILNVGMEADSVIYINAKILKNGFGCFKENNKIDFLFVDDENFEIFNNSGFNCEGFAMTYLNKYNDYRAGSFIQKIR